MIIAVLFVLVKSNNDFLNSHEHNHKHNHEHYHQEIAFQEYSVDNPVPLHVYHEGVKDHPCTVKLGEEFHFSYTVKTRKYRS